MPRMQKPALVGQPARRVYPSWLVWVAVATVIVFFACIRIRLLDIPLERDEGEYAYAGQLMLDGIPPYKLAYNMKLPGTYAAYALIMAAFGETVRGIHLGLLLANAAATLLVFLIGRKLFDNRGALVSCASYALLSTSPSVVGLAAHANHFVVLCALAGLFALQRAKETGRAPGFLLSGLLLGLGFVMKQPGIIFCLFGGLWWMTYELRSTSGARTHLWRRGALLLGGMILPFVLTCLILLAAGVFPKFWFWTFSYAGAYASTVPFSRGKQLLEATLPLVWRHNGVLWLLAGVGLTVSAFAAAGSGINSVIRLPKRRAAWLIAFLLFSIGAVCPGLYFRPHYFILVLPAAALLIGAALHEIQGFISRNSWPRPIELLPITVFVAGFAFTVFSQRGVFFQASPSEASLKIYGTNPFEKAMEIGRYVRENTAPEAKIAVVGSEPEIYFYAHRHSATGYIYTYPLMEDQPYARQMQREMIQEIESAQPEFLLFVGFSHSWLMQPDSDHTILDWFNNYQTNYVTAAMARWQPDPASGQDTEQYIQVLKREGSP